MNSKQLTSKITSWVGNDLIEHTIAQLKQDFIDYPAFQSKLQCIESQLSQLQEGIKNGNLSTEMITLQRNNIRLALLKLAHEVQKYQIAEAEEINTITVSSPSLTIQSTLYELGLRPLGKLAILLGITLTR